MIKQKIKIAGIPAVLWGEKSDKLFIAVHGSMSSKEDVPVQKLAEEAVTKDYQILSFDLPGHGERRNESCMVWDCVHDLKEIMIYARSLSSEIYLFANSMGAYFSLLAYAEENLRHCLFLSPIVDMKKLIDRMMAWANVTEEQLKEKRVIATSFGQTLYEEYYCYVKEHPVQKWNQSTAILYGSLDNMTPYSEIQYFAQTYGCNLQVMEQGEHYFHTDEQLNVLTQWLKQQI